MNQTLRVRSSASEVTFRTAEPKEIWELVLDRLRAIQADLSWEPPQSIDDEAARTQRLALVDLPVARSALQSPAPAPLLIDRLVRQYELDDLFFSPVDQSAIGLNFGRSTILLVMKSKELTYAFDRIVSVEAVADNVTLSQTNRGSQLLGAAVGNVLFGGAGLLAGALTGSSRSTQRVKEIKLRLTLDDQVAPSRTITFFATGNKKGLPPTDRSVALAGAAFDRIYAQLALAMRRVQTAADPVGPGGSDELSKLWELKQKGALTQQEFDQQKKRVLRSSGPDAERGYPDAATYSLHVIDWGSSGTSQRVIAMLREMSPSVGFWAAHKILRTPSYCVAQKLSLSEAARIRARFYAVGVAVEVCEELDARAL